MALAETNKMRPMTPVQLRVHLQRTLKRALEMDLASQVKRLEYGTYQVPSTSRGNVIHLVTGTDTPLDCTCEAFLHMPLCVHRAAVLLKRWAAEGRTIAVNEVGDVVVRSEEDAAALAYPTETYPALVLPANEAPPPSRFDADIDLILDLDGDDRA